jgi:hypothetical protein
MRQGRDKAKKFDKKEKKKKRTADYKNTLSVCWYTSDGNFINVIGLHER